MESSIRFGKQQSKIGFARMSRPITLITSLRLLKIFQGYLVDAEETLTGYRASIPFYHVKPLRVIVDLRLLIMFWMLRRTPIMDSCISKLVAILLTKGQGKSSSAVQKYYR